MGNNWVLVDSASRLREIGIEIETETSRGGGSEVKRYHIKRIQLLLDEIFVALNDGD